MELEQVFKAPVIESYGMTEACAQITSNPLPPRKRKHGSVGMAAGPEVVIIDEEANLIPADEIGEIAIRGENVMGGYENNPDANEAAFANGWFRTGDQGYLDTDGYLFISARLKELINRGGEKIAPREIDERLMDHPEVRQAVAFAVPHKRLGEDIVAAVVLKKRAGISEREIREFLLSRLADFKVPSQIVFVHEIPKGPTGKVQRIGLAKKLAPVLSKNYVSPRNDLENNLATIWAEVLGLEKVGAQDNFFALGGDSLLATLLMSRLRSIFQIKIPLIKIFADPTLAGQALLVEEALLIVQSQDDQPMKEGILVSKEPAIPRRGELDPCPVSFAQQRLWFLDQFEPGSAVYNIPAAVRITGLLNVAALEQSLNETVQRHEALRTTFSAVQGEPMQVINPTLRLTLAVTDLQQLPEAKREAEAQRLAGQEARRPFDLSQGPLLRATLLRLDEKDHVLLLTMHHIVSDGWSMGVLFREVSVLYEAFTTGGPSPLPELPIQYADFAVWQRQWLQGEVLEKQLDYWRKQLEAAPHRSSATDDSGLPRGAPSADITAVLDRGTQSPEPSRRGHAVYDASGRIQDIALPLYRARGHHRRFSHCQPQSSRD
jgi:acyl carrier protein